MAGSRRRCGQVGASRPIDCPGSRALWATAQTHSAAANQGLALSQGAGVPGERSSEDGNQDGEERKGVTRRQSRRVTNY